MPVPPDKVRLVAKVAFRMGNNRDDDEEEPPLFRSPPPLERLRVMPLTAGRPASSADDRLALSL